MSTLDLKVLRDDGYLQEANRQFFHPLGLALAINIDDAGNATLEILDARDDPHGFVFSGEEKDLLSKARNIRRIADTRIEARKKALGFWIQRIGGFEYG